MRKKSFITFSFMWMVWLSLVLSCSSPTFSPTAEWTRGEEKADKLKLNEISLLPIDMAEREKAYRQHSPELEKHPLREEFDEKFVAWKRHCSQFHISIQSNTDSRTKTPEYDALIAMGKPALPLLMEKLEAGEFFLNKAVQKITGIDVVDRIRGTTRLEWGPGSPPPFMASEQGVSKLWLDWWKEHKDDPEWKVVAEK